MEGLYRQVAGQIMGLALAVVLKSVRRVGQSGAQGVALRKKRRNAFFFLCQSVHLAQRLSNQNKNPSGM